MLKKYFLKNFLRLFSIICFPLICVSILIFAFSTNTLVDDAKSKAHYSTVLIEKNMTLIFNETQRQKDILENNSTLFITLVKILNNFTLSYEEVQVLNTINSSFNITALSTNNIFHSLYVYLPNRTGSFYSSSTNSNKFDTFYDTEWYYTFLYTDKSLNTWFQKRYIPQYAYGPATPVISVYQRIKNNGVLVTNINATYLESLLDSITEKSSRLFFILDENNVPLAQNTAAKKLGLTEYDFSSSSFETTVDINGSNYYIRKINSYNNLLKYVFMIPSSSIFALSINIIMATCMVVTISLIISLILAYRTTKKRHDQIHSILSVFEAAEMSKPLPTLQNNVDDEYSLILNNIIKTFVEKSFLALSLSDLHYKKLTAQLTALQCQVNPHFLFNTLQTIDFEIKNNRECGSEMLKNLSYLLKYSLADPSTPVTIRDEIEASKLYINIQKNRYDNKFDAIWDYDDDILSYPTTRLILQPFIENSIYHGIKEKEGNSVIKIRICKRDKFVKYVIIDNGVGMNKEELLALRAKLNEDDEFSYTHIGIFNTNKRILLQSPHNIGVKIRSKKGKGTVISFYLALE